MSSVRRAGSGVSERLPKEDDTEGRSYPIARRSRPTHVVEHVMASHGIAREAADHQIRAEGDRNCRALDAVAAEIAGAFLGIPRSRKFSWGPRLQGLLTRPETCPARSGRDGNSGLKYTLPRSGRDNNASAKIRNATKPAVEIFPLRQQNDVRRAMTTKRK